MNSSLLITQWETLEEFFGFVNIIQSVLLSVIVMLEVQSIKIFLFSEITIPQIYTICENLFWLFTFNGMAKYSSILTNLSKEKLIFINEFIVDSCNL